MCKPSIGVEFIFFQLIFGFNVCFGSGFEANRATIDYLYPTENQVIYYQNLELSWHNSGIIVHQRLQVSQYKDFSDIFIDTIIQNHSFGIESLEKNTEFYWRVIEANKNKDASFIADYSFFKTTSLHLQYDENNFALNFIPAHTGDQQLLFIDNPDLLNYSISIFCMEDRIRKFDHVTRSENHCVPLYKLPKGKYIMKIHFTEMEHHNVSEIFFTQNE